MPKESDSGFDPRNDMIGTGPFYVDKYTPSVGFTLKRHPEYWDKDYALVDTVETPIVSEYSAALAQFKAGNIYSFGSYRSIPIINPEDVLPTKREVPKILIYQGELTSAGLIGTKMSFGWLGKSPFLDERVRQAFSMAMDRDLYLDTFFNVSAFQKEGLPVDTFWNSHLQAEYLNGWLDPRARTSARTRSTSSATSPRPRSSWRLPVSRTWRPPPTTSPALSSVPRPSTPRSSTASSVSSESRSTSRAC